GAVEEAQLGVGHAQVGANALGKYGQDLPVEEVEDVDQDQDGEHVARVAGGRRSLVASGHGGYPPFSRGSPSPPGAAMLFSVGRRLIDRALSPSRGPLPRRAEGVALPRPRVAGFVLGTCAAACWGLGPVATKAALDGYSPEIVGVVRLGAAALCFRALAGRGTRWLPDERWLVLAGVALGVDFLLFNYRIR